MRHLTAVLCSVLFCCLSAMAQANAPSDHAWNKHEGSIQDQMNGAPTAQALQGSDLAELRREALELTALSQSVSADIDALAKGLLAKDLDEKLKRMEKLSKKLRIQLARPLK